MSPGQRKRTFPLIFQGRAWLGNDFGGRDAGDQRKPSACEDLYGRVSPPAPFFRGDLPNLRWQSARNVLAVFPGDHAHALLFRYSARPGVGNRFGNAKHGELEHFKPVVSHCITCFGHQALMLPRQPQPEAAIISFTSEQANCADQLVRGASQAKRPGPFISAFDSRQGDITIVGVTTIRWIRPRHHVSDVADNLPVGK